MNRSCTASMRCAIPALLVGVALWLAALPAVAATIYTDRTLTRDGVTADFGVLLDINKGEIPVYINVKTPGNGTYMLKSKTLKIKPSIELVEQLRDKIGRPNVWVGG